MERAQVRHGRTFGRRAARLEKRIWHLLRTVSTGSEDYIVGGMVPRIAHEIEDERTSRPKTLAWLESHGYWFFYGLQVVLIVIVVFWLEHS